MARRRGLGRGTAVRRLGVGVEVGRDVNRLAIHDGDGRWHGACLSRFGIPPNLHDGVIEQVGPPREAFRRPRSRFVADFIGECNGLEGVIIDVREGRTTLRTLLGHVTGMGGGLGMGSPAWVEFRPESVQAGQAAANTFNAVLDRVNHPGEVKEHLLESAAVVVRRFVPIPRSAPNVGQPGVFHVDPADVLVMARPHTGGTTTGAGPGRRAPQARHAIRTCSLEARAPDLTPCPAAADRSGFPPGRGTGKAPTAIRARWSPPPCRPQRRTSA